MEEIKKKLYLIRLRQWGKFWWYIIFTKTTQNVNKLLAILMTLTCKLKIDISTFEFYHAKLIFRWFKFTLKPPYSITCGKLRLPFGTLPFGLFGSNLDTRDLETYPRTYCGYFGNMSLFRWFKFTLKPPYSITHDKLRLVIWDTSFWTFWVKFGHKGPWDIP